METLGLRYAGRISGVINPEDMQKVPDSDWVIASSMVDHLDWTRGLLYAVNVRDHSHHVLFPDRAKFRHDATRYDETIPVPCADNAFHGIGLKPGANGVHALYVVNHAVTAHPGRHAVEAFEVRVIGGALELTHVGTVLLPEDKWPNDVAPLPGAEDGFVVSSMFDPRAADGLDRMAAGERIGHVMVWTPAEGWSIPPGGNLAGPNGVEVSPDGTTLFAALWPMRQIARLSRHGSTPEIATVDTDFLVDNFTWTADGALLCAGQWTAHDTMVEEFRHKSVSDIPIGVIRIDPRTLAVDTIIRGKAPEGWGMASVALEVGDEIWLGTPRNDGILRFAKD